MTKRIALVTGGMGGIGEAICRLLHDRGVHVVAAYARSEESALAWQKKQAEEGYAFDIAYADLTQFESATAMVANVLKNIGPIDILVNNAGITRDRACHKMTQEDWDIVIDTDLNSIFYVTHDVIPSMREREFGRIINISSINGQRGQCGQANYAAAKAGMHGFTKSLAKELAKFHVTVNTISPGYVATEMVAAVPEAIQQQILAEIPMKRFAEPHEVAEVVAFLADDKSAYITGANIPINGGHYML